MYDPYLALPTYTRTAAKLPGTIETVQCWWYGDRATIAASARQRSRRPQFVLETHRLAECQVRQRLLPSPAALDSALSWYSHLH